MDNVEASNRRARAPYAAAVAAVCAAVFITFVTILADLAPGLKDWLKGAFTHHWIGKSILAAALFVGVYALVFASRKDPGDEHLAAILRLLSWLAIFGTALIFAFYLWEAFLKT